jgi:hypothetical protein
LEILLGVFHSFEEILKYAEGLHNFLDEVEPRHLEVLGGFQSNYGLGNPCGLSIEHPVRPY